jgi:hypothetical protein
MLAFLITLSNALAALSSALSAFFWYQASQVKAPPKLLHGKLWLGRWRRRGRNTAGSICARQRTEKQDRGTMERGGGPVHVPVVGLGLLA